MDVLRRSTRYGTIPFLLPDHSGRRRRFRLSDRHIYAARTAAGCATESRTIAATGPIALYPDGLIAQLLPAATYSDQIVDAGRWMRQHQDLKGDQLAKEVDKQPWDASVKALTQFPAVLANVNQNLAWTSELGDAYVNQQ